MLCRRHVFFLTSLLDCQVFTKIFVLRLQSFSKTRSYFESSFYNSLLFQQNFPPPNSQFSLHTYAGLRWKLCSHTITSLYLSSLSSQLVPELYVLCIYTERCWQWGQSAMGKHSQMGAWFFTITASNSSNNSDVLGELWTFVYFFQVIPF